MPTTELRLAFERQIYELDARLEKLQRLKTPEAKNEGRPPARLPSLSTPRQSNEDALPPVKRGVAALSPLNAVTPDARPVGMRRHFFTQSSTRLWLTISSGCPSSLKSSALAYTSLSAR